MTARPARGGAQPQPMRVGLQPRGSRGPHHTPGPASLPANATRAGPTPCRRACRAARCARRSGGRERGRPAPRRAWPRAALLRSMMRLSTRGARSSRGSRSPPPRPRRVVEPANAGRRARGRDRRSEACRPPSRRWCGRDAESPRRPRGARRAAIAVSNACSSRVTSESSGDRCGAGAFAPGGVDSPAAAAPSVARCAVCASPRAAASSSSRPSFVPAGNMRDWPRRRTVTPPRPEMATVFASRSATDGVLVDPEHPRVVGAACPPSPPAAARRDSRSACRACRPRRCRSGG